MSITNNIKGSQHLVAKIIIEELYRNNINCYAFSPGARSIPFLYALNEHEKISLNLFNDERSAAFWALGYAKATNNPVVLIATSGTAIANYLPAIIEAKKSRIPLVVITCDRPWELKEANANQTIKQENIYGEFVKFNLNIPAIEKSLNPASLLTNIDQISSITKTAPSGPVHLNIAFRKPFEEENYKLDNPEEEKLLNLWYESKQALTVYAENILNIQPESIDYIKNSINSAKRPIIIAGALKPYRDNKKIVDLAKKLNTPIIADINSNLRGCSHTFSLYNAYINKVSKPDLILYLGDRIVSEPVREFITNSNCRVIQINDYDKRQDAIENEFLDISYKVNMIPNKLASVLEYKCENIKRNHINEFIELEDQAKTKINELTKEFSEATAINSIFNNTKENSSYYISSSLILRESEFFATPKENSICACNRGAVGIDGIISSACGFKNSTGKNLYLIIGDQATLHDLNALKLAKESNLHIFLINNSGGAIFNILNTDGINAQLQNSQNANFQKLANAFDINYQLIEDTKSLEERILDINSLNTATLTEIKVDGVESTNIFIKFKE